MTLVLIPCAVCGRDIRAASEDITEGGVDPSEVTCSSACQSVFARRSTEWHAFHARGQFPSTCAACEGETIPSDPRPDPSTHPDYWTE